VRLILFNELHIIGKINFCNKEM